MDLERAVEVFVKVFSASKSQTHPYNANYAAGIWIMRDAPRKKERKIEVVSWKLSAVETIKSITSQGLPWHFVCHLHRNDEDFQGIREQYKRLGYRPLSTEWMFVHDLKAIPEFSATPEPRIVSNSEVLSVIPQLAQKPIKMPPLIPGEVEPPRLYCVWDDGGAKGRVTSFPYQGDTWVSDLHVNREDRGKGYGRALMSKMLQDDKANGVGTSILLASSDGARLYPHLGYRKIATLQVFCPAKR
jgi:hypothetical protein